MKQISYKNIPDFREIEKLNVGDIWENEIIKVERKNEFYYWYVKLDGFTHFIGCEQRPVMLTEQMFMFVQGLSHAYALEFQD